MLGVARPEFDATNGDLPSGVGGQGWGFYAVGGQLVHNGRWGDWEGMQSAPPNAEVGLLLDYERATLTVFINEVRCGILADGIGGPLCWSLSLSLSFSLSLSRSLSLSCARVSPRSPPLTDENIAGWLSFAMWATL